MADEANVGYYYIGETAPSTNVGTKFESYLKEGEDDFNPLFNFDQNFVDGMQSVGQVELGQLVPYVSLAAINSNGEIIEDFSMNFFHKAIDMSKVSEDIRYSDRPTMSLKSLEVKTDQASGYLYYTHVTLQIKIHRPDLLRTGTLVSLLFPNMPLRLEYGWKGSNPEGYFNKNVETLNFAVRVYNLTLDATGQIDLTVEGTAFNDRFNNTLIGDIGEKIEADVEGGEEKFAKNKQLIFSSIKQLNDFIKYLEEIRNKQREGSNDYNVVRSMADRFTDQRERIAKEVVSKKFNEYRKRLDNVKLHIEIKEPKKIYIKLHDIIQSLFEDTFRGMTPLFGGPEELKIIYGNFNENVIKLSNMTSTSIAEFPIDLEAFKERIKAIEEKGQYVPTVESILNILMEFVESGQYWKMGKVSEEDLKKFELPDIVLNFSNRKNAKKEIIAELAIIDANEGVPTTVPNSPEGKSSQSEAEKKIIGDSNIPVVKTGHANSFIKTISLSHIMDQSMKAVLIERMYRNKIINERDSTPQFTSLPDVGTPLTLPLKGSATVIGHPGWKPFRVFYLSAGIFVVDAVYKILKVVHRLSAEGYETDIEFMYN